MAQEQPDCEGEPASVRPLHTHTLSLSLSLSASAWYLTPKPCYIDDGRSLLNFGHKKNSEHLSGEATCRFPEDRKDANPGGPLQGGHGAADEGLGHLVPELPAPGTSFGCNVRSGLARYLER